MSYTKEEKNGCAHIAVDGPFSIYEAPEFRKVFLEAFENSRGMILNLEKVSECDTAGIQLLCSARSTAEAEGKSFGVDRMSDAVIQALIAGGLTPEKMAKSGEED